MERLCERGPRTLKKSEMRVRWAAENWVQERQVCDGEVVEVKEWVELMDRRQIQRWLVCDEMFDEKEAMELCNDAALLLGAVAPIVDLLASAQVEWDQRESEVLGECLPELGNDF